MGLTDQLVSTLKEARDPRPVWGGFHEIGWLGDATRERGAGVFLFGWRGFFLGGWC